MDALVQSKKDTFIETMMLWGHLVAPSCQGGSFSAGFIPFFWKEDEMHKTRRVFCTYLHSHLLYWYEILAN